MKINKVLCTAFLFFSFMGCSKHVNELYTDKSVNEIQLKCEESVKTWIKNYAEFPDSYVPLMFDTIGISSAYTKGIEIIPLRRFRVEHTFIIRNKDYNDTHATLQFELTPDYFIQNVKYKQPGVVSLEYRIFPPKYELWSELYGRALSKTDTLNWKGNNHELLFKLSQKYFVNRNVQPEGENAILTDSLVAQLNRFYITN